MCSKRMRHYLLLVKEKVSKNHRPFQSQIAHGGLWINLDWLLVRSFTNLLRTVQATFSSILISNPWQLHILYLAVASLDCRDAMEGVRGLIPHLCICNKSPNFQPPFPLYIPVHFSLPPPLRLPMQITIEA